jgi:hypothetical protein
MKTKTALILSGVGFRVDEVGIRRIDDGVLSFTPAVEVDLAATVAAEWKELRVGLCVNGKTLFADRTILRPNHLSIDF